jgi:AraC-like DNA-binding protein
MSSLLQDLCLSSLLNNGFYPVDERRKNGYFYRLDPDLGEGRYYLRPVNDLFLIVDYTIHCTKSYQVEYKYSDCIAIGTSIATNSKKYFGFDFNNKEHIWAFSWDTSKKNNITFSVNHGDAISSIGIAITREYFKRILSNKIPMGYNDFAATISEINESTLLPDVMCLLKQLRTFSAFAPSTELYYDAKVLELIALIIQWHENKEKKTTRLKLYQDDVEFIKLVIDYLDTHYALNISMKELCSVACMSQNKLSGVFKQIHGVTVNDYIQQLRAEKGKELLLQTDMSVREIAHNVGYHRHGSFTEIFKQKAGMSPIEYRKRFNKV